MLHRLQVILQGTRHELETDAKRDRGFTLIELLVVITILGILAAVVVFSVAGIGDRGQANACKTDTVTIKTAEEAYFALPGHTGYTDMVGLTGANLLSTGSTLHNVTLTGTAGSATAYAITDFNSITGAASACVDS